MLGPFYINNDARRWAGWGPPHKTAPSGRVEIYGKLLACDSRVVPAFRAWEIVRRNHNYEMEGNDTGIWNYRHMRHDPAMPLSSHSWGVALDANWQQNPAGKVYRSDMPQALINDLLRIKTNSGVWVFMWGGDWDRDPRTGHSYYDAMHWEVVAHPLDLATGVKLPDGEMEVTDLIKVGDRGNYIRPYQTSLNNWAKAQAKASGTTGLLFTLIVDGVWGTNSANAMKVYQQAAQLPETGEIDFKTGDMILRYERLT